MTDRPLAAGEVVLLHRLCRGPAEVGARYGTWRLDREGLVAPAWRLDRENLVVPADGGKIAITDEGRRRLAEALANPPRLNPGTIVALGTIDRAGREGWHGCWPGPAVGLDAVRLFGLVRSVPPNATAGERATWQLTEAGQRELVRVRASQRATAPMSRTQADVVRAVASGQAGQVASDRPYTSCHRRGWLAWATDRGGPRHVVTPAGWRALVGYHRRQNVPLRLPTRHLAPGHIIRPPQQTTATSGPARVVRVAPVATTSGATGYVVLIDGPRGGQVPYPNTRPLPPAARFEVVGYQPAAGTGEATTPLRVEQRDGEAG